MQDILGVLGTIKTQLPAISFINERTLFSEHRGKMIVDKKLVKHVAKVARLDLTESEIDKFVPQLKDIIEAFSQLQDIDVTHIEPSFQPVPIIPHIAEDTPKKSVSQEKALCNSQHNKEGYFMGPKAV